jgi:hypothetical protein
MKPLRINAQLWKNRLRDPFWQFAGVVVGVITILITVAITYDGLRRAQARPELTITIEDKFPVVIKYLAIESDIQVLYRGVETKEVSAAFFTLANTGNVPILPSDYIKPISLTIDANAEIADVAVISRQPENVDLSVTQTLSQSLKLSKALLNAGDILRFRLILVHDTDPYAPLHLSYSGRIAGVRDAIILSPSETELLRLGKMRLYLYPLDFVLIAIVTAFLLSAVLFILRRKAPATLNGRFPELRLTALAIVVTSIAVWAFALAQFLIIGPDSISWQIWWLPIALGAILAVSSTAYIVFLLRLARRSACIAAPLPADMDSVGTRSSANQETRSGLDIE